MREVVPRMPKYRYGRFANACDVTKAWPVDVSVRGIPPETFLNLPVDGLSLKSLKLCERIKNPNLQHLLNTTIRRIDGFELQKHYQYIDLSFCSFWLNKDKPLSVIKSSKSPLNGKIYASVSVRHDVSDEYLFVQELETRFGYTSPMFAAKATVAFPPICHGEVWTVGWIQGVTKYEAKVQNKNENNRFLT